MNYFGVIRARPGGKPLTYERWCELVRNRDDLVKPIPMEGKHPLTREPVTLYPRRDAAFVVLAGDRVGDFHWSQSGDDEVIVYGRTTVVADLAREFASLLEADYEELPRPDRGS